MYIFAIFKREKMIEVKLVKLVLSLTKAEKRNFKLFMNRNHRKSEELKQILLFDIIERFGSYHTKAIQKELVGLTIKHVHELSLLLYRNILKSIRIMHSKEAEYGIREMIDYAHILYQRGLFADGLELLAQAKRRAKLWQKHFLVYEIIDFEKKIESRHVTSSHQERAHELTSEAIQTRVLLEVEGHWTELSLQLYDFYLKSGHSRTEDEKKIVESLFRKDWPEQSPEHTSLFYEQLYFFQCHVWYYYIIQQFAMGFRYAVKWIELFERFPAFAQHEKFQLLKGYHNCLSVLFYCQDRVRFDQYRLKMERFIELEENGFDENTRLMAFSYKHLAQLNSIVMEGRFSESVPYLMELEAILSTMESRLDHHRLMIFRYKMSTIYFTMGNHKKCLQLLNMIIHNDQKSLHEDVQSFARILNLIAHYELGNIDLIFFQVKSVYRFLLKLNETQAIQKEIIAFLRKMVSVSVDEVPSLFQDFYNKLAVINLDKYESRVFLYLDVLSWLESKMQNRLVEDVIREKRR